MTVTDSTAAISSTDWRPGGHSTARDLPGFSRSRNGKPVIGTDAVSVYSFGLLIRQTEQLILRLFSRGLVSGTTHTCIGQELCQMSLVRALDRDGDAVLSNHRNHGHFLTYSGDPLGLVAEIMGREGGVCGGYGGSQHIAYRHFHSNGVQAGMTGIGVGLAKARQMTDSDAIVVIVVGDGTLGEGLLYESLNLAAIWQLPTIFVVENNGIAQTTYTRDTIGGEILNRGKAFGLQSWELDDADESFMQDAESIVNDTRRTLRPGFVVINTRRMGPHSKGDDLRPAIELEQIALRDPLARVGARISNEERRAIEERIQEFLDGIERDALSSPESKRHASLNRAYSNARGSASASEVPIPTGATVRERLNFALATLLEENDRTILLGEDLHEPYGGAFKVTEGLSDRYAGRVISTPISEAGMTGASIGLAISGFRPIQEIMFADFMSLCMDQIYNHAAKFPGMFPGLVVPMIIRSACGGRRGYGPTHSQSPENIFVSVPGLTVVCPSHRHNVAEMLINGSRCWQLPLLLLENKLSYGVLNDLADYRSVASAGDDLGADIFPIVVRGASTVSDACVVTWGGMLLEVEKAVSHLEEHEELAVDVVVLSLLSPLPRVTLMQCLAQYEVILIAEESHDQFGVSAELMASLSEHGYKGIVARVGADLVPIASARTLEKQIIPGSEEIVSALLNALGVAIQTDEPGFSDDSPYTRSPH